MTLLGYDLCDDHSFALPSGVPCIFNIFSLIIVLSFWVSQCVCAALSLSHYICCFYFLVICFVCLSFDEFLLDMKQNKRKNIRQERKKVSSPPPLSFGGLLLNLAILIRKCVA